MKSPLRSLAALSFLASMASAPAALVTVTINQTYNATGTDVAVVLAGTGADSVSDFTIRNSFTAGSIGGFVPTPGFPGPGIFFPPTPGSGGISMTPANGSLFYQGTATNIIAGGSLADAAFGPSSSALLNWGGLGTPTNGAQAGTNFLAIRDSQDRFGYLRFSYNTGTPGSPGVAGSISLIDFTFDSAATSLALAPTLVDGTVTAVPEPSAALLASLAALSIFRRRR
ncbi:MAG: hypothetical protein MUF31_03390 [Akkermansiaceae bacterium]|jgi:hypothetical protein|nr:hypothetical protein [Akkermansiaceae bacterium]